MTRTVFTTGRQLLLNPIGDAGSALGHFRTEDTSAEEFAQKLRDGCKQLSQLVAWMWFPGKITSDRIDQTKEDQLKHALDAILKYQAFNNNLEGSDAIEALLLGNNESENIKKIYKGQIDPSLTLEMIYEDLTNNSGIYVFLENFVKNFYTEVGVDTFEGSVSYDFLGRDNPTGKQKFITVVPYPPKPELGEFTVSKEELKSWAQDASNYYPPNYNPYIPINGSC